MIFDQFISLDGEECIFVNKGSVVVRVADEVHHLNTGDSMYFASAQTHFVENDQDEEAVLIWALTPPQL
jgi:quercetin dioxygenase-like cupin family protein